MSIPLNFNQELLETLLDFFNQWPSSRRPTLQDFIEWLIRTEKDSAGTRQFKDKVRTFNDLKESLK